MFSISYYKMLQTPLTYLGMSPRQSNRTRVITFSIIMFGLISYWIPAAAQVYKTLNEHNTDEILESISPLFSCTIVTTKIANLNYRRKKYRKIFKLIEDEWKMLKFKDELHVLEEVTKRGSAICWLYSRALYQVLVIFILIPLAPVALDAIIPLNETRKRQQIFKLNYFVDQDENFLTLFMHLTLITAVSVVIIVTNDSMYMMISHHACGLFAICGHHLEKATDVIDATTNEGITKGAVHEWTKKCVRAHHKAIEFAKLIEECSQTSLLIVIGLVVVDISATAVQIVMQIDQPEEVLRLVLFVFSQQFHLFVNSLPGQKITDYSMELAFSVYNSKWYEHTPEIQKMLYIMQIRSVVPSVFTAGGLYVMNMENFGMVCKTSVSYCTMMLSFRQ